MGYVEGICKSFIYLIACFKQHYNWGVGSILLQNLRSSPTKLFEQTMLWKVKVVVFFLQINCYFTTLCIQ